MSTQLLDEAIEGCEEQIIAVRRDLHAHPDPSGAEHETSRKIFRVLSEAGIDARVLPTGRGVVAEIGSGTDSPMIALRADIDALRITDEKQAEYSSRRPNLMHACGHDGHTAIVLGAVLGLHRLATEGAVPHPFRVRALFQPAEETGVGAQEMISAGALEEVSAIIALHLDSSRAVGRVGIRYGVLTAACDDIRIHIEGEGGHAARPHETCDPIAAAAQLISNLYVFVPRATSSNDSVVLTIGQMNAGDNHNVIPTEASLRGTLRTLDTNVRAATRSLIRRVAEGVAQASGTRIDMEFSDGPASVVNDDAITQVLHRAATELLGEENIDLIATPSMGGEDFAYYLAHVPGAMLRLGCSSGEATSHPLHSSLFDIDERSLAIGAKTLARAALLWTEKQTP